MAWLLLLSLALAQDAVETVPAPPVCPAVEAWPSPDWAEQTATAPAEAAAALDAYLFAEALDRSDKERRGVRTDGVVVVHRGVIVHERYGGGYTAQTPHLAWSATKSFTNALTGIAVRDGVVALDDSICDHLEVARTESCAVTVEDLLEFASGWDWRETYEGVSPTASSVLAMLYGEGRHDMARFVAGHPFRDPPGTSYMYSSGDTNVLSAVVGSALTARYGERFPFTALLEPIGMSSAVWERDGSGTFVGSSYLYATPRDLARFGYLLLADGCWEGERLLPEGWVAASTEVSEPYRTKPLARSGVQGRQFWLNRLVPEQGQSTLPWPDVPDDAFAALGHWKQSITVVPSRDLVVVRTADDRDGTYDHNEMLRLALALIGETP